MAMSSVLFSPPPSQFEPFGERSSPAAKRRSIRLLLLAGVFGTDKVVGTGEAWEMENP
jgi:hypothetical protein